MTTFLKKEMFTRLTIFSLCICKFVILVVSRFGVESGLLQFLVTFFLNFSGLLDLTLGYIEFGDVSSSSWCLGWAALFYFSTPWVFNIVILDIEVFKKCFDIRFIRYHISLHFYYF